MSLYGLGLLQSGHMYPVFHNFSGGKGVATSIGVFISFKPACFAYSDWLGSHSLVEPICFISKYGRFAGCINDIHGRINAGYFVDDPITSLVIYRHKTNIIQIVAGKERKFNLVNSFRINSPNIVLNRPARFTQGLSAKIH